MYLYQEVLVNYKGISTTQEDLLKNKSYLEDLGFHVLYAAGTDMLVFNKERDTTKPSPVTDISI